MKTLFRIPLISAALWFGACSQNNPTTTNDTTGTGQISGVNASLFDLPSSMASTDASVELADGSLAKVSLNTQDSGLVQGLEAYRIIPQYVQLANQAKDSVQALIQKLANADLPENYQGDWDGMQATLHTADSLYNGEEGRALRLTLRKDSIVIMHLRYLQNAKGQYQGSCFFRNPQGDSLSFLLRFSNFNEGLLGKRMTLWVQRPNHITDDAGAPTILRIRAVHTPKGRILLSGISYHPNFAGDDFWTAGPKVYGFRMVADPEKDKAVLRVAFANADSLNDSTDLFTKYSLDKAVADRAAEIWKISMLQNDTLARLVSYSLEHQIAVLDFTAQDWIAVSNASTPDLSNFTGEDLRNYLQLNAQQVMAGDADGRVLFFYTMVRQPIFLDANATIVGFLDRTPANFPVESSELDSSDLSDENPLDLDNSTLDDTTAELSPAL